MDNIPYNSDKLVRLENIIYFEQYLIAYGYTEFGEGIFQKYYFADSRWKTLRCRNLPYRIYNFSMTKFGNEYLLVNGKYTEEYNSSSYTIRIGYLTEQELDFKWSYVLDNDEICINQQILTDGTDIFTVISYVPNQTEISVYNPNFDGPRKFKLYATSSRPLPRVNVKCRAVHYNRRIYMFTHILPNEQGESLVRFDMVDVYDVSTDQWIRDVKTSADGHLGRRPTARVRFGWAQCPTNEHYVYMTGGHGHDPANNRHDEPPGIWRLDLRTFRWTDMNAAEYHNGWPWPPPVEHRVAVTSAGNVVYVLDDQLAANALRMLWPSTFIWLPKGDNYKRGQSAIPEPDRRPLPCPECFRVKCAHGRLMMLRYSRGDDKHPSTCSFCTAIEPTYRAIGLVTPPPPPSPPPPPPSTPPPPPSPPSTADDY